MPKAVLFWSGKLMRLATGFWAAFASAAVWASSDSAGLFCLCPAADADALSGVEGGSCANDNIPGKKINESDSNRNRLVIPKFLSVASRHGSDFRFPAIKNTAISSLARTYKAT